MSEEQDSTINNSHVDTTQLKLPTKALPTIITEYVEKDEVLFKGYAPLSPPRLEVPDPHPSD